MQSSVEIRYAMQQQAAAAAAAEEQGADGQAPKRKAKKARDAADKGRKDADKPAAAPEDGAMAEVQPLAPGTVPLVGAGVALAGYAMGCMRANQTGCADLSSKGDISSNLTSGL